MLEDLEPQGRDLDILSKDEGYIVWTDWADPKMDVYSSGTIRSYLGTFELFLHFVTMERVRSGLVPAVHNDIMRIFRNTIPKLKGWRKTIDLEMRPQKSQKRLDECDNRLTTKDVNDFKQSKVVQHAKEIIARAADGEKLTMYDICEAKDYIIAILTIKTGIRPGALENTLLKHYKSRRTQAATGYKVILVPEHKRGVAGPAPLTLDEEMQKVMEIYVTKILPQFGAGRADNIFLTSDGKAFLMGRLSNRLPTVWGKSNVRPDLRVTATNIRKWIVTVCHEKQQEGLSFDETSLRQAMCHSKLTAETFYLREDLTEVAAKATAIIAKCTTSEEVAPATLLAAKEPDSSSQVPIIADETGACSTTTEADVTTAMLEAEQNTTSQVPFIHDEKDAHGTTISDEKGAQDTTTEADVPSDAHSTTTEGDEEDGTQREASRPLQAKEKRLLSENFQDIVNNNVKITIEDIRPRLREISSLRKLLVVKGMDRKATDHLRYMRTVEAKKATATGAASPATSPQAENQDTPSQVAPAKNDRPLDPKEKALIWENFQDMIKSNRRFSINDVRARLRKVSSLQHILEVKLLARRVFKFLCHQQLVEVRKVAESRMSPSLLPEADGKEKVQEWMEKGTTPSSFKSSLTSTHTVRTATETTSRSSTRTVWTASENMIIEERFSSFNECPTKKEILEIFEETEELKHIFTTRDVQRCIDKIKNMFKQRKYRLYQAYLE